MHRANFRTYWYETMRYFLITFFLFTGFYSFPQQSSLLWEISGKELKKPSYLYGTMHVQDARVFQFGDSVLPAFERCEAFAGELLVDNSNPMAMMKYIMMPKDTTLSMLLNEEEYKLVKEKAEEKLGFLAPMIDKIKPFFTSAMLAEMEFQSDSMTSLDDYFQKLGKEQGKKLIGIETAAEQITALDKTSLNEQAKMLVESLQDEDKYDRMIDDMFEIYLSQDLDKLEKFMNESGLSQVTTKSILIDRNKVMTERIDTIIQKRPTFIGIGAAHLGGKEGVIKGLEEIGYTVKPIYSKFSPKVAAEVKKDENGWFVFETKEYQTSFPVSFKKTNNENTLFMMAIEPGGSLYTVTEGEYQGKASKFIKNKLKEYKVEGIKVLESRKFMANEIPALEVTIEKGTFFMTTTYYCLNEKYVEMTVTGKMEDRKSEKVTMFFQSFRKK